MKSGQSAQAVKLDTGIPKTNQNRDLDIENILKRNNIAETRPKASDVDNADAKPRVKLSINTSVQSKSSPKEDLKPIQPIGKLLDCQTLSHC